MMNVTHELITSEWEKDYPKPNEIRQNIKKLPELTLKLENKFNKYWEYYHVVEKQWLLSKKKLKQTENILRTYYSKKPLSDEIIHEYDLQPLQVNYSKTEIDMMVKSDERYCDAEYAVKMEESLMERIKEISKFITSWKYNQKSFIQIFMIENGHIGI